VGGLRLNINRGIIPSMCSEKVYTMDGVSIYARLMRNEFGL